MKLIIGCGVVLSSSLAAMNDNKSFIHLTIDAGMSLYPKCINMYQPWSATVCGYWSMDRRLDEYEYSSGCNDPKTILRYVVSSLHKKKCIYGNGHPCTSVSPSQKRCAKQLLRTVHATQGIAPGMLKVIDTHQLVHFRRNVLYQIKAAYYNKAMHENCQYDLGLRSDKMADYYRPCKTYYERKNWLYFQKHVHKELYIKHALGIIKKHKAARAPQAGVQSSTAPLHAMINANSNSLEA